MPFRFSLEEVLEYRRQSEELRQREVATVQNQVDHVSGLLAQARDHRRHYAGELNRVETEGQGYARQEIYLNYIRGLSRLIERTEAHLEDLRAELLRRRALLQEAARARRVLEELEQQERRTYLIEETRAEAKAFDEIAIRNYSMRRREKSAARTREGLSP